MEERKQSILKQKTPRAPLQEVNLPDFLPDDETVTHSRRVSFGTNLIKEFIVGSSVSTQCVSEYEQAFSSSDSSMQSSLFTSEKSSLFKSFHDENGYVTQTVPNDFEIIAPPCSFTDEKTKKPVMQDKTPRFSSTIVFSAESPTADMQFTEGCISLAKSICQRKDQDMTAVIIKSNPSRKKPDESDMDMTECGHSELTLNQTNSFEMDDDETLTLHPKDTLHRALLELNQSGAGMAGVSLNVSGCNVSMSSIPQKLLNESDTEQTFPVKARRAGCNDTAFCGDESMESNVVSKSPFLSDCSDSDEMEQSMECTNAVIGGRSLLRHIVIDTTLRTEYDPVGAVVSQTLGKSYTEQVSEQFHHRPAEMLDCSKADATVEPADTNKSTSLPMSHVVNEKSYVNDENIPPPRIIDLHETQGQRELDLSKRGGAIQEIRDETCELQPNSLNLNVHQVMETAKLNSCWEDQNKSLTCRDVGMQEPTQPLKTNTSFDLNESPFTESHHLSIPTVANFSNLCPGPEVLRPNISLNPVDHEGIPLVQQKDKFIEKENHCHAHDSSDLELTLCDDKVQDILKSPPQSSGDVNTLHQSNVESLSPVRIEHVESMPLTPVSSCAQLVNSPTQTFNISKFDILDLSKKAKSVVEPEMDIASNFNKLSVSVTEPIVETSVRINLTAENLEDVDDCQIDSGKEGAKEQRDVTQPIDFTLAKALKVQDADEGVLLTPVQSDQFVKPSQHGSCFSKTGSSKASLALKTPLSDTPMSSSTFICSAKQTPNPFEQNTYTVENHTFVVQENMPDSQQKATDRTYNCQEKEEEGEKLNVVVPEPIRDIVNHVSEEEMLSDVTSPVRTFGKRHSWNRSPGLGVTLLKKHKASPDIVPIADISLDGLCDFSLNKSDDSNLLSSSADASFGLGGSLQNSPTGCFKSFHIGSHVLQVINARLTFNQTHNEQEKMSSTFHEDLSVSENVFSSEEALESPKIIPPPSSFSERGAEQVIDYDQTSTEKSKAANVASNEAAYSDPMSNVAGCVANTSYENPKSKIENDVAKNDLMNENKNFSFTTMKETVVNESVSYTAAKENANDDAVNESFTVLKEVAKDNPVNENISFTAMKEVPKDPAVNEDYTTAKEVAKDPAVNEDVSYTTAKEVAKDPAVNEDVSYTTAKEVSKDNPMNVGVSFTTIQGVAQGNLSVNEDVSFIAMKDVDKSQPMNEDVTFATKVVNNETRKIIENEESAEICMEEVHDMSVSKDGKHNSMTMPQRIVDWNKSVIMAVDEPSQTFNYIEGDLRSTPKQLLFSSEDAMIMEELTKRSKESGCLWRERAAENTPSWSFTMDLLESTIVVTFTLKQSNDYSSVTRSSVTLEPPTKLQLEKTKMVTLLGYEALMKNYFRDISLRVDNTQHIPHFLDRLNSAMTKLNNALDQILKIYREYPGSKITEGCLSFRLFSFAFMFSCLVFVDLKDLFNLSKSELRLQKQFGNLNEAKIKEIFGRSLKTESVLLDFVVLSNKYIITHERDVGKISRRDHITLLRNIN